MKSSANLIQAYSALITLWFVARLIFADRLTLLAVINTFPLYLFSLLPLAWIIAFWQRSWTLGLSLLVSTGIFLHLYGALFLPTFASTNANNKPIITVQSFNILLTNKNHTAIINSIAAANADIVGLQEVTQETATALIPQVADQYPYHTLTSLKSESTVAILSRHPIEQVEWYDFIPRHRALRANITIGEESIVVYIIHLTANEFVKPNRPISEMPTRIVERYRIRTDEVETVEQLLSQEQRPTLLLCDCNLTDTSAPYTRLNRHLSDSFRKVGWGLGHTQRPKSLPFAIQRIDYIWYSAEFNPISAVVGQDGDSDHYPLVSKFTLP